MSVHTPEFDLKKMQDRFIRLCFENTRKRDLEKIADFIKKALDLREIGVDSENQVIHYFHIRLIDDLVAAIVLSGICDHTEIKAILIDSLPYEI